MGDITWNQSRVVAAVVLLFYVTMEDMSVMYMTNYGRPSTQ